jgi:hypothetical protein
VYGCLCELFLSCNGPTQESSHIGRFLGGTQWKLVASAEITHRFRSYNRRAISSQARRDACVWAQGAPGRKDLDNEETQVEPRGPQTTAGCDEEALGQRESRTPLSPAYTKHGGAALPETHKRSWSLALLTFLPASDSNRSTHAYRVIITSRRLSFAKKTIMR